MKSKFNTIFESNFTRFQGSGFLTGDIIKLRDGWERDEWCKDAPGQVLDKLKELHDSDLILRVSSVKPMRPGVQGNIQQDQVPGEFFVDVAQELSPGMYNGIFVTVPGHMIEISGDNDAPPALPDSLRREDDVDVKPRVIEQESAGDDEMSKFTNPAKQTNTEDKVNKHLTDKDIKQPGATAAASYTAGYMK
jgi:hypothetical protein